MKKIMKTVLLFSAVSGLLVTGFSACGEKQATFGPALPAVVAEDGLSQTATVYADTTYKPNHISAKAGVPLLLTFKRPEKIAHCIQVLAIPEMNLKKDLTLAPETVIEIPAHEKGQLGFECGMGMRKGRIDFE